MTKEDKEELILMKRLFTAEIATLKDTFGKAPLKSVKWHMSYFYPKVIWQIKLSSHALLLRKGKYIMSVSSKKWEYM